VRDPWFDSRVSRIFMFAFCYVVAVFLLFLSKTQNCPWHFSIPFAMLIYLVC